MTSHAICFGPYILDRADRRLSRDGAPVDLNARYFDALALLAAHPGQLITKDRFLDEVWRGVPVTDEALTQCIKTLRRALDDDAAAPRFIETVPKHGYRFVARVGGEAAVEVSLGDRPDWRSVILLGGAMAIGGGLAGLVGGLIYGLAGVSQPTGQSGTELSMLLVIVCLCILAGVIGGAGVGFGIALASRVRSHSMAWTVTGGALGGLLVGAAAKLLGLDAFSLLVGRSPGDITGGAEAAVLGAATGLGAWLAIQTGRSLRSAAVIAGLIGGAAGLIIALAGGALMAGSLDALAREFPGSRLTMVNVAALLGESGFGSLARAITSAAEGALFAMFCVGAMILARRGMGMGDKSTE